MRLVRLAHPASCYLASAFCLLSPSHHSCRAVWYCGTACSHADWWAGHRRVCKVLAAERQVRKQAAAAAAAEQQQKQ